MFYDDEPLDYTADEMIDYLKRHYPKAMQSLWLHSWSPATFIATLCKQMIAGQQITIHAFPGWQVYHGPYLHARFLRLTKMKDGTIHVSREGGAKFNEGLIMTVRDLIEYYYSVSEAALATLEMELSFTGDGT